MPVEAVEGIYQPVNREPEQVGVANTGNMRRLDTYKFCGGSSRQLALPQDANNCGGQIGLDELGIRASRPTSSKGLSLPLTSSSFSVITTSPLGV